MAKGEKLLEMKINDISILETNVKDVAQTRLNRVISNQLIMNVNQPAMLEESKFSFIAGNETGANFAAENISEQISQWRRTTAPPTLLVKSKPNLMSPVKKKREVTPPSTEAKYSCGCK
jgi:hypothetical protein